MTRRYLILVTLCLTAVIGFQRWDSSSTPGRMPVQPSQVHAWLLTPGEAPVTLTIKRGDAVRLTLPPGPAGTLHLHGLEIALTRAEQQPAHLTFTPAHSGRFEAEWHPARGHDASSPGVLNVYPR